MTLIRIGQLTVNVDQIALIRDLSSADEPVSSFRGGFEIEFQGGRRVDLVNGVESEALRAWLSLNAEDLVTP